MQTFLCSLGALLLILALLCGRQAVLHFAIEPTKEEGETFARFGKFTLVTALPGALFLILGLFQH